MQFQIDPGAHCYALPVAQYKKATEDDSLTHVLPDSSLITVYGGTKLPVISKVLLPRFHYKYNNLVSQTQFL